MINMINQISKKIKEYRLQKGLTLKELSEITQLSISFLSQVERSSSSLSITSLQRIADALGVPVSEFFQSPVNQAFVVQRNEQKYFRLESSITEYCSLAGNFGDRLLEPLIVVIPPGDTKVDKFAHPGEEFYIVLEGSVTVYVGDEAFSLNEGDSIHFSSGIVHGLQNRTQQPVKLISVLTPRIFN